VGHDAGPEGGADAGHEAGADTGADAGHDAGADAPADELPACSAAYSQSGCFGYVLGTKVSSAGHNWLCSNGNCSNCSGTASCAPGASGCPWGVVWTDEGACR
jgi:hypothetical protein